MAVETAKDRITINQIIGQKQETMVVDGDVIVSDVKPDILKIINTNGTISIYKKEILDGKIKIDGSVNTYLIYLADDENGSIRSLNTSLDFTQVMDIDKCNENMTLDYTILIKDFEVRVLNSRKIHIKAFVDTTAKVYSNSDIEIISSINMLEDMQILDSTEKIMTLIGEGSNKIELKETLSLDETDELAEILKIDFFISDEETKISYNKALIKANANMSVLYLTEDNRINSVKAQIPVMGFVDIQDISDKSICNIKTTLRSLIIKPNNSNEHTISLDAELEIMCSVYEEKNINIIEDIYSVSKDIELKQNKVNIITDKFIVLNEQILNETINVNGVASGRILNVSANLANVNSEVRKSGISYNGNVLLEIIIENDNDISSQSIEIPFELDISEDRVTPETIVETNMQIVNLEFSEGGNNSIDMQMQIQARVLAQNNKRLNILDEIEEREASQRDIYSMIIYFVKPGDTLWKIAKQFRSKVEDIARVNGIENENKIYPGEQLYIPKFTRNSVAV